MRFILVGSHACHDDKGRYHLRVYHDSLTRAVIEERECEDETEWTATMGEWDRIGSAHSVLPTEVVKRREYPKDVLLRDVVHKLERAAPGE